jgi:hypothetical protein
VRDVALFGTDEIVWERYRQRYIPGQQLYLQAGNPKDFANAVVYNNDPENPALG